MAFNTGGALSGAGSGAATGFSVGGPWGAAIGGVAGGLLGAFGLSRERKKKAKKLSTLDPTQQGIYNEYARGVQGKGGRFQDLFNFNPQQTTDYFNRNVAAPAYEQYQQNVIPGITGQFRGRNLQNSSYLGGALSNAGRDVQRNLDTQLANMLQSAQENSVSNRINGINNILGTQTFAYQQPQASGGDQAFGALLNAGGTAFGNIASGRTAYQQNQAAQQQQRQQFTPSVPQRQPLPGFQY